MSFGTVAILGPGLIGGSLALALAERGLAQRLTIYARSPRALDEIRIAGVEAELSTNPSEAVREADVVILCVPIGAMPALVKEFRDALKPDALVTDVGSVKGSVDAALTPLLRGKALWIGSHPMAGSEQSGFVAARADLFENAAVIVTPTPKSASGAEKKAADFWRALGSRVFMLSPEEHDFLVAEVSHLPHLLSSILTFKMSEEGRTLTEINSRYALDQALEVAGGGFRDMTRIARGSPELWAEIVLANRSAVGIHLRALAQVLVNFSRSIDEGDKRELANLLTIAQKIRLHFEKLCPTRNQRP